MSVTAKAERLLAEGRIQAIPGRCFAVEGDHGWYLAVVNDDGLFCCSCPAVGECSHVLAARSAQELEVAARALVGILEAQHYNEPSPDCAEEAEE